MGKLTAKSFQAALATPGTYQDGDGLYLKVRAGKQGKAASAQWTVRIQHDGKRRDIGLGSARLVSLADARDKAREARLAMKVQGRDIVTERRDAAAAQITF
ncbi:Arm DNA-binding domain-containing protein [Sphingorhabdus arenilitoris]|uniref:Arm DNA-binding domain-containing protein n=1 Tax=Sphingorhabdus arenilitoris TaxID=1490041 RepID=A0ABV8RJF4_9SPHN